MKSLKYELEFGSQFLRDLKLAKRRGLNMKDLSVRICFKKGSRFQ